MNWAFSAHRDSDLLRGSLRNLRALSQRSEFHDGISIGSICSGWGVAEMVLEALNDKLESFGQNIPKA